MQYISKIQGRNFRSAADRSVYDTLQANEPITLEREPLNPFDPNAIKVFARGKHIGYIEREIASFLAYELDRNRIFKVKVDHFESSIKTRTIFLLIQDDITADVD